VRLYFILFVSLLILLSSCTPLTKTTETELLPAIRVLLAELKNPSEIELTGRYYLHAEEARYEFDTRNSTFTVNPHPRGIQLVNVNRNLLFQDRFPVILKPAETKNHFKFNGHEYSGSIYLDRGDDSSILLINVLPLNEYLKGVVPAEIPSLKSDQFQAVKAQAICARTYAVRRMSVSKDEPFDVYGSISDQAYAGYDRHTSFADQAVNETRGMILTFAAEPAVIYYHSTCGGKLEAATEVWPDQTAPYLTAGIDAVSDLFSCIASPYFRWTESKTLAELDSSFNQLFRRSLLQEPIMDTTHAAWHMRVTERSQSGRVQALEIGYADTTVNLSDYQIRRFFAPQGKIYLPSTLFYFTQPDDSTVVIHGAGNGHGVGMCQYGALNMSNRGFQYFHILAKYFPNTALSRYY
jgi:stage II sporulation protein D